MSERRNIWRFAGRRNASARALGLLVLACVALAGVGLLLPGPGLPYLGSMPLGPALAGAAAAAIALVLSWPLRLLLRRRPGYYGDRAEGET